METTQKNREQTQRPPRQTPPPSAQQGNGAVRSPEQQRSAASARSRSAEGNAPKKAAPVKKSGQKKPAPKRPEEKKKQTSSEKKQAVPKKRQAVKKPAEVDVPNRKRAYGNSKPKKTPVSAVNDMLKQNAERKADRLARQGKKPAANRPKQPTPAVIYTQPAAFNRNRLLVQLATMVAIVLALVMGVSVFFKVEHITVSGADVYSEWAIKEASGLEEGEDSLLTFSRPRAGALIQANLPYINEVRFGIKLPDTVNIIVKEDDVAYAIKDQSGTWWMMSSQGRVIEMGNNTKASNNTQILGVTLENPVPDQRGVATEVVTTETMENGELIPITTTGAQRLTATLQILQALEANGIVGEIASVDVTRMEDIVLWYGSRYQVNLGNDANLDHKIASMHDVILQMSEWQSGILDVSFTIWPSDVIYTPFS
ncbi:MAG: FtsQ-type POTRA domain-containing protein [Oscillospiraceae bacterium]|nr:FtsQ-type POTRA domain-containing protein [Oscillospiraceae bacterium]